MQIEFHVFIVERSPKVVEIINYTFPLSLFNEVTRMDLYIEMLKIVEASIINQ